MAAILNSTILDSAIMHKNTSLIHSHTTWWWQHLEFCQVGFFHCHLGIRHLVIFSQIHSKTLSLHSDSDWKEFNLINLMMAAILKCAILDSAIVHKTLTQTNSIWLIWWWQPSWILPSWIQPFWTKKFNSFILTQLDNVSHLEFYHFGFSHFAQNKLYSFILTQLEDGSHLEFCQVGFSHCHLGFRQIVIFS